MQRVSEQGFVRLHGYLHFTCVGIAWNDEFPGTTVGLGNCLHYIVRCGCNKLRILSPPAVMTYPWPIYSTPRTILRFCVAPLWDSRPNFFWGCREWPLILSVNSTEELEPANNKKCVMQCTSCLSRFASTLKPPQSREGYDRLIALTLAQPSAGFSRQEIFAILQRL